MIKRNRRSGLGGLLRLFQILRVLAHHKVLGALFGKRHWPTPVQVREAFEELGLVFLKFGQVLAMRHDLLPTAYIDELEVLHDDLPPMSFEVVRSTVEQALGSPLTALFSSFDQTPVAAATIAQVHDATTQDGCRVAVKVQRPGLVSIIATDMAALSTLVALGEKLLPRLRAFELHRVVSEFDSSLRREIDFNREARSAMRLRTALADFDDLWIPDIVSALSSDVVLTMDFSVGERIDLHAKRHPEAIARLIDTLVRLMLQSIFEEGIFHADPHPGNVFVLPDGRLSLLDFGNTGELDEPMRESLALLLEAVVKGDVRAATEAYLEMASAGADINRAGLIADMKAALYEVRQTNMAQVSIGDALDSLMTAGTRNGVHNPAEFVLLTRVFVILESMIGRLDPQHDYITSFGGEIDRLTEQHFAARRIKDKSTQIARDMERLIIDAPGDTRRVLRRFAEGDLGRLPGLEALGARASRNLERLAKAIAYAALVISGSLLLLTPVRDWHHLLGEAMIISGIVGMLVTGIGAMRRDHGRR